MTILLIGIDGVGKTAVAGHLAKHYLPDFTIRASVLTKPNKDFLIACSTLSDTTLPANNQTLSFVPSVHFDLENYKNDSNIIQDSLTTVKLLGYHIANGPDELINQLDELLHKHPKFDKAFFLDASPDIIKKRLCKRDKHMDHYDALPFKNEKAFMLANKAQKDIAVNYFGATIIDTSKLTIDEVAKLIINSF